MTDPSSPFSKPLRLTNLVRGLIALAAVIAIGAAFAAGRVALGIAGLAMLGVAIPAVYWVSRIRHTAEPPAPGRP